MRYIVGNKAKGQISKRVLQENEARQISRKTKISYEHFSENLSCFVFFNTRFEICSFALLPTILAFVSETLNSSLAKTFLRSSCYF